MLRNQSACDHHHMSTTGLCAGFGEPSSKHSINIHVSLTQSGPHRRKITGSSVRVCGLGGS
ncbi:hypothetical protein GY45DRAFT_454133 [Cubamyces sp. BRFM 1775]|nr:hypothetical protein GY45DRAFT_454133 [Cubamyces sp. BRFM 1775]